MAPKKEKIQKPGEKPTRPGEYVERGSYAGKVPKARQVTIEPGDNPLPPTQKPGHKWERKGPPKKIVKKITYCKKKFFFRRLFKKPLDFERLFVFSRLT